MRYVMRPILSLLLGLSAVLALACGDDDGEAAPSTDDVSGGDVQDDVGGADLEDDVTAPSCRGTPAGQAVSFVAAVDDIPLRWDVAAGCVPVTYDTAAAGKLELIRAAHQAWEDISCSRLCFEEPVADETVPDPMTGDRGIHWSAEALDEALLLNTSVTFHSITGVAQTAVVTLPASDLDDLTDQVYLWAVGRVSGLDTAAAGADSVMVPQSRPGGPLTALGADDEEALCTLYGTPGYCD